MNWISKNKGNIFLFVASLAVSLLLMEIVARFIFPHTPTFGSFFPRYTIDSINTNTIGFYKKDEIMPFAMKPKFSHVVSDRAWHPKPFKVSLDKFGYRNRSGRDNYSDVLVGDSVGFGFGVDDDETIAAELNNLNNSTYNLSIPGAGPEMYMSMIDSFIIRSKTKRITILFFTGNDFNNLADAYWDGLEQCKPPASNSKIRRMNVSGLPTSPPLIFYVPLIRNSVLASLVYSIITRPEKEEYKEYKIISENAISDIKIEKRMEENKEKALKYLNELIIQKRCLNKKLEQDISELIARIKADRHDDESYMAVKNITNAFMDARCYPIGSELVNLVPFVNYYAGYFYEEANGIKSRKYSGNQQF